MPSPQMKRLCAGALLGLFLATAAAPAIAQDLVAAAARGAILAEADPLAAELRARLDEAGRKGFDIGMGIAEGQTLPGPGKQRIHDALPLDQQAGYASAVLYSITRNANLDAARIGAQRALTNAGLRDARRAEDDPFFALGFDIATGLLIDNPGGIAGASQSMAANKVYASLTGATQRGFEASARLQGSNLGSAVTKANPIPAPGESAAAEATGDVDRVGTVPKVAGMNADEARGVIVVAGYELAEVERIIAGVPPPYDKAIETNPPGGTTLQKKKKVELLVPRAWTTQGTVTLTADDYITRLGFDLDSGKHVHFDDGTDLYMNYREIWLDRDTKSRAPYFKLGSGVTMVQAYQRDGVGPALPLGHRLAYQDCIRAFREKPLVTGESGPGVYCLVTSDHHTVHFVVAPGDTAGAFSFRYALFSGDAGPQTITATGRVYGSDGAKSDLSICEMAKIARDRTSPAAAGLAQKCTDSGGTIPQ